MRTTRQEADLSVEQEGLTGERAAEADMALEQEVNQATEQEANQVIDEIVQKRNTDLGNITHMCKQLEILEDPLKALEVAYNRRIEDSASISPGIVEKIWSNDSPSLFLSDLQRQFKKMETIRTRFTRDWINIAVTGSHRVGKSRLLRSITGLGIEEIPTGDFGSLTAAVSTIAYEDIPLPRAEVKFHSPATFLEEVIKGYFKVLGLGGYEHFLDNGFKLPTPAATILNDAANRSYYERLMDYHRFIPDYKGLLTGESRAFKKQAANDRLWILPYIAWYDPKNVPDPTANTERVIKFTKHMAVRSVEIYCKFKNLNVRRVRLIDMPGLGELRVGLKQSLENAIREQADITLFVVRPTTANPTVDAPIADTHKIIVDAINPVTPDKSVIVVINQNAPVGLQNDATERNHGDNRQNCRLFKANAERDLLAAEYEIVDCSNDASVLRLVDTILRVLNANVRQVDALYLRDRLESLRTMIGNVEPYLSDLKQSIDTEIPQHNDSSVGYDLGVESYHILTTNVNVALEELYSKIKTKDNDVDKALQRIRDSLQNATLLPSIEEIKAYEVAQDNYPGAYGYYRKRIKADLWDSFNELANAGNKAIERAKVLFASKLYEHGLLRELKEIKPGVGLLTVAADHFKPIDVNLKNAFLEFAEYQHSLMFLEFYLYRLLPIMNDENSHEELGLLQKPEDVRQRLTRDCKESADKLQPPYEEFFENLVHEPNFVAFVISRKFFDRAFYATGARNSWIQLWSSNSDVIWKEKFGKAREARRYLTALQQLSDDGLRASRNLKP